MKFKQPQPLKSDIKLCLLFLRRVINGAVIITARTSQQENICALLITALDIKRLLMWKTCPEEIHSQVPIFNLLILITLTQIRDILHLNADCYKYKRRKYKILGCHEF